MIDTLICMKKALSNNQGIGEDLPYLHKNCIIHLDLKHENMLLDDNMMPKILNFCLSSCFKEKQNQAIAPKQGEADLELLKVCGERMIKELLYLRDFHPFYPSLYPFLSIVPQFTTFLTEIPRCWEWFGLIAYRVLKYNLDTSSGNIRGDEPERKGDQGTKDWPLCSYSLTVPLIARPCLGSGSLMLQKVTLQKVTSPRPPRSFLVLFSTSLRHWSQFSHILFSIGVAF